MPDRAPIKVVGWGFLRLPGERRRQERAEREARELMRLACEAVDRDAAVAGRAVAEVRDPAEVGEPAPMDGAMHSVWLHGNWRWLTQKMTTPEREAAADAVQRYNSWLNRQDDEVVDIERLDLRWWRD